MASWNWEPACQRKSDVKKCFHTWAMTWVVLLLMALTAAAAKKNHWKFADRIAEPGRGEKADSSGRQGPSALGMTAT